MKTFLAAALGSFFLLPGFAHSSELAGDWARGDGKARVKIARCGENICATNTWIKPGTPNEKAGDVLVMKIRPTSAGRYEGSAFDPQRNLTYRISVAVSGDAMTSRGCVLAGLVCKGVGWARVK